MVTDPQGMAWSFSHTARWKGVPAGARGSSAGLGFSPEKYRSSQARAAWNTGRSGCPGASSSLEVPPKCFCPSSHSPVRAVPSLARVSSPTGEA